MAEELAKNKKKKSANNTGTHLKKTTGSIVFDTINTIFMILFCISILFPIWDMIVRSFSKPEDISYMSINLWPKEWTLSAYQYCFRNDEITGALLISIARTISGTALHLLVCCMAAYALTRNDMPGRKLFSIYFVIPMFISAGMIPNYLNMKDLGLLNNFLVYILPTAFSMYNAIVIRNYFYSIDKSLEESAALDGASQLTIFFKIILPLSKPVIATVTLWQMVGQWNSWYDNMVYTRNNSSLLTLQYLLRRMLDSLTSETQQHMASSSGVEAIGTTVDANPDTIKAATTIIVVLPILLVYPFLQRYFVQGTMAGAVKG